jgi:ribosome recycling factor
MIDMILMELEEKMEERVKNLSHELAKVRTGRANPKMFDEVHVPYYGVETPITQVANISVPEPTQILIKPYDRSIVKEVEKAILAANLGVTPNNEGTQLRIVLPPLTRDVREELVKMVKKYGEEAKISIRNYRRDANDQIKKLEKNHEISEDDSKIHQEDVQDLTDKYVKKIEEVVKEKDEEIMHV